MFSSRNMVSRFRGAWARRQFWSPLQPRPPTTAKAPIIDSTQLIEEETVPWYDPADFYPVRIGEVFRSRYQVAGKLGYGGYSTVWLCHDLVERRHVTVKVCSQHRRLPVERELAALEHLNSLPYSTHLGRQCIRTCLDHFELPAEHIGKPYPFQCFVFKPTTVSVWRVRQGLGGRLPVDLVKSALRHVLCGLAYLHQEANMVHTDIQEENILITLDDPAALAAFEEAEWASPLPRKQAGDRTIYLSRPILSKNLKSSHPVLTDFGEARFGRASYTGPIQPEPYRAPEVILGMPWDEKADIWSVGVMAWHMLQGREMFQVPDELDEEGSMRHHMAHVVSLLGPPPVDFLKRSETEEPGKYFDAQGNWIGTVDLPKDSLELSEQVLEGENKAQFLRFIRKMVAWRPEDRSPAHELLEDPWVREQGGK